MFSGKSRLGENHVTNAAIPAASMSRRRPRRRRIDAPDEQERDRYQYRGENRPAEKDVDISHERRLAVDQLSDVADRVASRGGRRSGLSEILREVMNGGLIGGRIRRHVLGQPGLVKLRSPCQFGSGERYPDTAAEIARHVNKS